MTSINDVLSVELGIPFKFVLSTGGQLLLAQFCRPGTELIKPGISKWFAKSTCSWGSAENSAELTERITCVLLPFLYESQCRGLGALINAILFNDSIQFFPFIVSAALFLCMDSQELRLNIV